MNEFKKEAQEQGNDAIHSAHGFIYSFLFFSIIFTIAAVVKIFGS